MADIDKDLTVAPDKDDMQNIMKLPAEAGTAEDGTVREAMPTATFIVRRCSCPKRLCKTMALTSAAPVRRRTSSPS